MSLSTYNSFTKLSNMTELLKSLILASEKAANIARICRQNELIFSKLIEEKTHDSNPRFVQDFKTLADVLIQESVRHDISKKFPELHDFIKGEENNTFSNTSGESITVSIQKSEEETCALLLKVCNDRNCSKILAREVHREIAIDSTKENTSIDFPLFEIKDIKDMAIWIDPIDSTLEYIQGISQKSSLEGVLSKGLTCATVLIGVYCQSSGQPVIGIINQPFHKKNNDRYISKIYWGVAHNNLTKHSEKNHNDNGNENLTVTVSSSEQLELITFLNDEGVKTVPLAGAGYKILNVILGNCDCFVLSKGSTYKWDTCGPHAILKAMGGGILQFGKSVSQLDIENCPDIKYNTESKNIDGLIAFKSQLKLEKLLSILNKKYS